MQAQAFIVRVASVRTYARARLLPRARSSSGAVVSTCSCNARGCNRAMSLLLERLRRCDAMQLLSQRGKSSSTRHSQQMRSTAMPQYSPGAGQHCTIKAERWQALRQAGTLTTVLRQRLSPPPYRAHEAVYIAPKSVQELKKHNLRHF